LRGREVERVRASVQEIIESGLSLSKLAVAVGLLADLAKPLREAKDGLESKS
jgi:hypothetical protein